MTRLTVALTCFLAIILSIAVFRITYQVDELEKELHSLNQDIIEEQETIHILRAEWSYLNDPERLRDLAERHLDLEEMNGGHLINLDMFNKRLLPPEAATPASLTTQTGEASQ